MPVANSTVSRWPGAPARSVRTRRAGGFDDVLSLRALNRALLERQLLLRRSRRGILETVEHLVGLQAQAPQPPYISLWSRLDDFRPEELSHLLVDRQAVRIAVMRGTVHLVSARDCQRLRPVVQPIFDHDLTTNREHGIDPERIDITALIKAARALLEERPRSPKELGALLAGRWPAFKPSSLAYAIRGQLALVQVPPRGLWGASGQTLHTTAEAWLGVQPGTDPSPDAMALRYLSAFGPASTMDLQAWSGLTGMSDVVERLMPGLLSFRDDNGRELLDLPDAPRPDPETPAPARFIAEYDNLLVAHADRRRIVSAADRRRTRVKNGAIPGTVLVDGFAAGTWRITRKSGTATLLVNAFHTLSPGDIEAVGEEGERLLRFVAAGQVHDVRFVAAPQ